MEFGTAIELLKPKHPTTRKFLNTISQRNLSPSLIEQLNVSGSVIRLTFLGESTGKPLLAEVTKVYDVQPNILTANIIELKTVLSAILWCIYMAKRRLSKGVNVFFRKWRGSGRIRRCVQ